MIMIMPGRGRTSREKRKVAAAVGARMKEAVVMVRAKKVRKEKKAGVNVKTFNKKS